MGQDVGKVMREEGSIHNLILLGSEKEGILFRRAAFPLTWCTILDFPRRFLPWGGQFLFYLP